MSARPRVADASEELLFVPAGWTRPAPAPGRDAALDLLRGLAMAILVVNHLRLDSVLSTATSSLLSAAEVLVAVSGVVVGIVFGRRWRTAGPRATARQLLARARKLYVASVAVVASVAALSALPWVAADAMVHPPAADPTPVAVLTLASGPWQFSILGFFVVAIAFAPGVLWLLARGWWPAVVAASLTLFAVGRTWPVDVLPTQSERPFPILVWQLLFVLGATGGWHRESIARRLRPWRGALSAGVAACGLAVAAALLVAPELAGPQAWAEWQARHFDKGSLDPARVAAMTAMAAAAYLALRRFAEPAKRTAGRVLLALGRHSFYVFIVHVFLCLLVASALATSGGSAGPIGNVAVQLGCLALLVVMVRRRFLFRWVPR